MHLLHPSVMTSSSTRDYRDLFHEVPRISGANRFDLFVLRDSDIAQVGLAVASRGRMSEVVSDPTRFARIRRWILQATKGKAVEIAALATYFPDISSTIPTRRSKAVRAVAHCVQLAIALTKRNPDQMRLPVVEIVCGTVTESEGTANLVKVFGAEYKIDLLCQSLREVVEVVNCDDVPYALALELEPGETYVINGLSRWRSVLMRLNRGINRRLRAHVGINFDIAHLRILESRAPDPRRFLHDLAAFAPKIVHAHVSDHPGIHTHDQTVGSWTNPQCICGGYLPYLRCLLRRQRQYQTALKRAASNGSLPLPFTGAIGIELEGNNRMFAIHDSVQRLKHAIAVAQRP